MTDASFPRTVTGIALAALTVLAPKAPCAPGDVEATIEAPCRYPTGLATDGTNLFVADWREAKIFQFAVDGAVLRQWDAPTLRPHGLAYHDGLLYVSDDHTGGIYALRLDGGVVEHAFEAPNVRATGLAWAGEAMFVLAGGKIYKILPEDGTILGYFPAPKGSCRCLTFDGTYLWVSDRISDEIYMVDPDREKVVGILDAPGPYAAGVAWLDHRLWNVDFQTRLAYQLVLEDEQMYRLTDKRHARVEYLWSLSNYGPADVADLVLNIAVPTQLPNQTLLSDVAYSMTPSRTAFDRWGQPCAVFEFGAVPAGSKAVLTHAVEAEVSAIRYLIIPEKVGSVQEIPTEIRETYTADSSRYRITSPYIRDTVRKIVGEEENPYWIARKIYDFIIDRLKYEMIGGWDIPEVVLKRGSGSCSEYTYSFVALCRAAGVPARYQGSIVVRGDDASIDEAFHRWAQVYLPGYGWVPVDANRGDKSSPADQARAFGELSNRFLITTQGGGDSEFLAWSYNSFAEYKLTGYCNIEEEHFGFWEPVEEHDATEVE